MSSSTLVRCELNINEIYVKKQDLLGPEVLHWGHTRHPSPFYNGGFVSWYPGQIIGTVCPYRYQKHHCCLKLDVILGSPAVCTQKKKGKKETKVDLINVANNKWAPDTVSLPIGVACAWSACVLHLCGQALS